jgi:signal transduction histidine kinase
MSAFWPVQRGAAVALLLWCVAFYVAAKEPPKRILLLNPNTVQLPATAIITRAATERLGQALPGKVEIYAEFLDSSRFPNDADGRRLGDFLADKYAAVRFDAVIALGPESLQFANENRARLGRDAPLVFCCMSRERLARLELPGNASGFVSDYDLTRTLDLAQRLQPGARAIVVIAGAAPFDQQWEQTARRQLVPFESRYNVRYLVGLPMAELLDQLRQLPRDTIVIHTSIFSDGAGQAFQAPREIVSAITAASTAPVYAPYDSYLDRGIVGGHMDTFEASGLAVADLALKMMAGEKPPPPSASASTYRVDWRQLRRWGLSEASLPPDSVVLFREPSFWDEYYDIAFATVAAFALQSAIVAFLLVERRRRLRAERSFMDSEERMGFAAASVNVGLWQYDAAGGQLWATDHCRAMFDIPGDDSLTRESFLMAVHPDDVAAARQWMHNASVSQTPRIGEFRVRLKQGGLHWYLARGMTRFDERGNPVRTSGAFSDITARKLAESEADAQRQTLAHITRVTTLGELSGAIAHEINQPLTAILSNAEAARRMLASDQPSLADVKEALDDIIQEDNRAGDVIRRLRGMMKRGERRLEVFAPNDLVASVLRLLHSELVNRQVSVTLDLASNLPEMSGDQVQIQQVLTNLVMNAMDAVTSSGASQRLITIATASPRPDVVETVVSDNGPGITADQQARLLEPFFTTKANGLGLGLPICNSIINAHGGVLSIVNGIDRGVQASFTLPVSPAAVRT